MSTTGSRALIILMLIKVLVCLLLLQVPVVEDPSVPGTGVERQEMRLQAPLVRCRGTSDATAPARAVEFVELVINSDFVPHDHDFELLGYVQLLLSPVKLFDYHNLVKLNGYIRRTDYCGIGVLTYGRTGYCLPLLHLRHQHVSICPDVNVRTVTLHIRDSKLNVNCSRGRRY
jgi:hypothetical protein